MPESKRYEILKSLPTYGPIYISVSDDDIPFCSEGFVVRFFKSDGTEWVANFKPGGTDFNAIYSLPDIKFILVFAGGLCYVMNPEETKPHNVFGGGFKAIFPMDDGTLIIQDMTNFTILELNGTSWQTKRISWDGFKDIEVDGNLIKGFSFDAVNQKWISFSYNIKTKELKR